MAKNILKNGKPRKHWIVQSGDSDRRFLLVFIAVWMIISFYFCVGQYKQNMLKSVFNLYSWNIVELIVSYQNFLQIVNYFIVVKMTAGQQRCTENSRRIIERIWY